MSVGLGGEDWGGVGGAWGEVFGCFGDGWGGLGLLAVKKMGKGRGGDLLP